MSAAWRRRKTSFEQSSRSSLEMASNKLVGKELEFAFDDTKPPAVQLDAVKDSLNRVGLVKPAQVEVGPIKPFEEIFDEIGSDTRAESRQRRGIDDEDSSNNVEYHDDSASFESYGYPDPSVPTAPAMPADAPVEPPRSTEAGVQARRDRLHDKLDCQDWVHLAAHGGCSARVALCPDLVVSDRR